jgi:hypothetical protein
MTVACLEQVRVDRHFDGTLAPSDEHAMREHLPGCPACTARYERRLLLEQLDPGALGAQERLARGLGLGAARPVAGASAARRSVPVLAALAMAAALLLFFGSRALRSPDDGFTARGGGGERGAGNAVDSTVLVYRAAALSKPSLAGDAINAHDELAFAYENGSAKRYLMIFGIDEHRHVYWYHPGWANPSDDPSSISIETTPGLHHLHEAIAHQLDGQELEIHALFTDSPLTVKNVEKMLASEVPRLRIAEAYSPGARESTLRFRVER